jgi:hypothetical protein
MSDTALFTTLARLREEWPSRSWSWDGRLPTATSAVTSSQLEQARAVVDRTFPHRLDKATLGDAPEAVRALVDRSGGLRDAQLAFYLEAAPFIAFGLWWPWGGGSHVSLRVGLIGAEADPALAQRLRDSFGVEA